jgi:hypothetical protein
MSTLSALLNLSPLTLVALTIGAETGQSIKSMICRVESEVSDLMNAGVLKELSIRFDTSGTTGKPKSPPNVREPNRSAQTEFCLAD